MKKNISIEGLENQVANNVVNNSEFNFSDLEWLKKNTPVFPEEISSSKLNEEREPKVQAGAERIATIDPSFNELLLLLAVWWENKEARKSIKTAIDNEATAKGQDPVMYMQGELRKQAEKFNDLSEVVRRMMYATTYFKPRAGQEKDVFKQYSINGEIYNVNLRVLAELKEKHGDNKNALLKELTKVSVKVEAIEEL